VIQDEPERGLVAGLQARVRGKGGAHGQRRVVRIDCLANDLEAAAHAI